MNKYGYSNVCPAYTPNYFKYKNQSIKALIYIYLASCGDLMTIFFLDDFEVMHQTTIC